MAKIIFLGTLLLDVFLKEVMGSFLFSPIPDNNGRTSDNFPFISFSIELAESGVFAQLHVVVNKLYKSGHNANPHLLLHPLRIAFTMNIHKSEDIVRCEGTRGNLFFSLRPFQSTWLQNLQF